MYTRYIPQPDGSYRRSRIPDTRRAPPPQPPQHQMPPVKQNSTCQPAPRQECAQDASISGFLRKILPKDFDTSDLLIILLLLLMAGDCPEEKNTALLTMIIYLIQ